MIEVNLLPGGKKRQAKGGGFKFSMPSFGGGKGGPGGKQDGWIIGSAATIAIAVGAMGWLFFASGQRADRLEVAVEEAVRDSARYADLIQKTEGLRARRDSIGRKVSIIQEIDGGRYIWAHLLDEVSRALPDYTWLTQIVQVANPDGDVSLIDFRLEGRAGNNFALTRFMENLEASPFVREVQLVASEQVSEAVEQGGGGQRQVHQFSLTARYEEPPTEMIETVPLFANAGPSEIVP